MTDAEQALLDSPEQEPTQSQHEKFGVDDVLPPPPAAEPRVALPKNTLIIFKANVGGKTHLKAGSLQGVEGDAIRVLAGDTYVVPFASVVQLIQPDAESNIAQLMEIALNSKDSAVVGGVGVLRNLSLIDAKGYSDGSKEFGDDRRLLDMAEAKLTLIRAALTILNSL